MGGQRKERKESSSQIEKISNPEGWSVGTEQRRKMKFKKTGRGDIMS